MATGTKLDLEQFKIYNYNGALVSASNLLPRTDECASLLIFVRSYACVSCQVQMAALEPLQHALAASKVRLIFVSLAEPWLTKEFLSKSVVQFPGELFSDPTLKVHKVFQLKREIWKSIANPFWPKYKHNDVMDMVEGLNWR